MKLLVTGGAGYVGSHACVELMANGHELVVVDNFSNSNPDVLRRVAEISGQSVVLCEGDVRDDTFMRSVFDANEIDAVVHFAGLKSVSESIVKPLTYFDNNVSGSLVLFETMARYSVKKLVFSSSAAVYGDSQTIPIREDFPLLPTNPYGRSKLMAEEILRDLCLADPAWRVVVLRSFNSVGAHASGLIGEDSLAIPNNLMPYICEVAMGRLPELRVFGNDFPTPDGTGIRDYVHVVDLALAYVAALGALDSGESLLTINVGTGRAYGVFDVVNAFTRESGRDLPFRIEARRPGDVAMCYADPSLAAKYLGWHATRDIFAMCRDAWNWQMLNPYGYESQVLNDQAGVETR